jgi:hypothetical protein
MIPRWQMVGCVVLALLAVAVGIYADKDSYWYAFLSGACDKDPNLSACHPRGSGYISGRGLAHVP